MNDNAIIRTVPAAGSLHQVPGFDPLKHLKRGVNDKGEPVMKLDLPYKRLWFRLACPNGRLLLNPLRITDQMAIFEAQVFFQREDATPASSFTSTKTVQEDRRYIRSAQDEALSIALDNAGFGIQLCDVAPNGGDAEPAPVLKTEATKMAPAPAEKPNTAAGPRTVHPTAMPPTTEPPKQAAPAPVQEVQPAETVPAVNVLPAQVQTASPAVVTSAEQSAPSVNQESVPAETDVQTEMTAVAETVQEAPQEAVTHPVNPPEEESPAEPPVAQEKGVTVLLDFAAQKAAKENAPAPAPSSAQTAPDYTDDMSVEEICQRMTVDEAMAVVVEDGICKGWTMGQVLERRRGSLKFFTSPFCEFRNTIKAAATLLFRELEQEKAR